MITDPVRACEAMLGQKLLGIQIHDDGRAVLTFDRGVIEFSGEDFEAYIEVEGVQ
jgi:hypothetical protein